MTNWLQQATAEPHLSHAPHLASPNATGIIDITPDTRRQFGVAVRSLIRFLGDVELTAVSPIDIHRWQHDLATNGNCRHITINSYLRTLRTIYGRLQRNGITATNPAAAVPYLAEDQRQAKAISQASYLKLLDAAGRVYSGKHTTRNRAILATLWATGCRLSGLIGMDATANRLEMWTAEKETRLAIYVTEKMSKSRWVYAKGKEAELIAAWLSERPQVRPLFTTAKNKRFTRSGMGSLIRAMREAAGNPPRSNPHAFRHAFALRQLNAGYDLATVSEWLGHSSPEFTAKVYAIRTEDQLRERYFAPPPNGHLT